MLKRFLAMTMLLAASEVPVFAAAKAKTDPRLLGSWGQSGETLYTFRADGTGLMENDPILWTSDGKTVVLTGRERVQKIPYQVKKDRLFLTLGGDVVPFDRMGAPPKERKAGKALSRPPAKPAGSTEEEEPTEETKPVRPAPPGNAAGEDKLSRLLLSSPWCSLSYSGAGSQAGGTSDTKRIQFGTDGTWSLSGRRETYSSGDAGIAAGRHDSEGGGQWKVRGRRLYMSNPPDEPELSSVDLKISENSNGYPILNADGVEYFQCE